MSTLSESNNARRASLKNLNVEDKKRVANLIKELAKTGEERELALERLQEERVSFDEQLSAVQEEQTALKQEREALKQRLEKSEKLLKKYESELKNVKTEKEEQDKMLKKTFQAQPQSTQTSPMIQNLGTDGTTKSREFKSVGEQDDVKPRGNRKTPVAEAYIAHGESTGGNGRRQWSTPQVPVYSNSLFDVKVSNVDHEQNSEAPSRSDEYQGARITESGSLHELYLREYSLQLRLQEQQIEIQRQQVQLQQQLQLLQQQQGLQHQPRLIQHEEQRNKQQQPHQQQQGLTEREERNQQHAHEQSQEQQHVQQQQDQPLQYQQKHSNESHKHQKQEWTTQLALHSKEHQQQLLDQQPYDQPQTWHQQRPQYLSQHKNENIFKQTSPTQQTNLLQKRTPEGKSQQTESNHRADTMAHEHAGHSPWQRHDHDHRERSLENSRHEHEAVHYRKHHEPRTKDRSYRQSSSPSRHHHHDVEKTRSAEEHHANRNKGQHGLESTHYHYETHDMTKRKSPRKHHRINDAKHSDLNNNDYFQPRPHSQQQKNRCDVNGNLVLDHYPHQHLSEPYSDTDDQPDVEYHYNSERSCHCGHYQNHTRQHHATLEYDQPIPNHSHSKDIPHHLKQRSPHSIVESPYQKSVPIPAQVYQQPNKHQHSPDRTNSYHQRLLHDPMCTRGPENGPPLDHHHLHKSEYHHSSNIRAEHNGAPRYVTQKCHEDTAYDAGIYQPSQETSNNQPTERRVYKHHQSGSPTGLLFPPQVGMTEHDYPASDALQYSRPQTNKDRSKDLLDDYIYNYQTAGQYSAKSNTGNEPRAKPSKHSAKRKISRKGRDERQTQEGILQGNRQRIQHEGKYGMKIFK